MEEIKVGQAGSLESNDLIVTVDLNSREDLNIDINSVVKEKFGKQIEELVRSVLQEYNVKQGNIRIVDKGALDFTIRARLRTAIRRSGWGV